MIPSQRLSLAAALAGVSIGWGITRIRRADQKRLEFNEREWKIRGLPWPSWWVRWINHALPGYAAVLLPLLKRLLIDPAVHKSVKELEKADDDGNVPKILCDQKARRELKQRLETYYEDIRCSPTLTPFGKVFNYGKSCC